ncbi:5'-nucleotidase [Pseudoclavibacter chungangensis]|uniref:bifunctional metallophosphatase/5'-nucleotidase n=1 Tax=Pseudoclavibacter chungangensis TaxID=587635 RepID=UPI0015CA76E7|nr:bifunctional UDP-sugar hydrolase/5'-nucleotidase [Pseudoclavibacter chungangensis]NYJ65225.1 5'-nucleotidase [Pseudoclavibacter chungangensis]
MKPFTRVALTSVGAAVAGSALAISSLAAPAFATVESPNIIEPTPGSTQINIVGFNDFHGRILDGERFAATLLQAQQGFGEDGSLVISNGDAVGASIFESQILEDQPAIDILNQVGVDSFTQGNHEFDRGLDDAAGRLQNATNGPDLAANVTKADGSKPFDEYALFTINGVTVAVVGAVTQETPSLVSPDGIAGLTFGDPVAAVNDVAARLSDGNPDNGEAQVIIASYHEGGPSSNVPIETNLANETFRHLTEDTSADVDAIYNAHTHQTYAYDAPIGDTTRPVIQAGSYGANIGQVVLTVDAAGKVTASASSVVPTLAATAIPEALKNDPRIVEIRRIVEDAKARADVLGQEVIGTQTGDITRAKQYEPGSLTVDPATGVTSGGTVTNQDDRANASSLGDMVAQSMVESVNGTGRFEADLSIMNPGGLRADLIDDDGKVTYKEAATVLPFANNLSVATVSGATLKQVLEQQWQTNPDGTVPSRAYLQLGLSDAFTYTFDSSRAAGDRITGMYLNDLPIDPAAEYHVALPTFLAAGGDNFRALTEATSVQDTGLIDLDAFVDWVKAESATESRDVDAPTGLVPDTRRNGIEIGGYPFDAPVACGDSVTLSLSGFDLASLGYIQNSTVRASTGVVDNTGTESIVTLGEAPVLVDAPNKAELTLTIPEDFATDTFDVLVDAAPSGSYAIIQVLVTCDTGSVPPTTNAPEPTTSTPATTPPVADDGSLANTGADANALVGGLVAAIVALLLGGTVIIVRRLRMRGE